MPAESASAAASTGIQAPGGSITKNNPGLIAIAIVAVVIMVFLFRRKN
jgi:nicotinamide mononucleotide (NMN) deamidase PncC